MLIFKYIYFHTFGQSCQTEAFYLCIYHIVRNPSIPSSSFSCTRYVDWLSFIPLECVLSLLGIQPTTFDQSTRICRMRAREKPKKMELWGWCAGVSISLGVDNGLRLLYGTSSLDAQIVLMAWNAFNQFGLNHQQTWDMNSFPCQLLQCVLHEEHPLRMMGDCHWYSFKNTI